MLIRPAQANDARRISYLIKRNTEMVLENGYTNEQVKAWTLANTPKAIRAQMQERTIFCAFENNQLIGTIALKDQEVLGFYVSYSKRGKGIGQKLFRHLEAYAKANLIAKLELTSTQAGFNFYLKNGFVKGEPVSVIINGVEFKETHMTKSIQ